MAAVLYPGADIAAALASSSSVREASKKLGMSMTALESRCREEGLNPLYEACAERGKQRRGQHRSKPAPMPTWSVVWLNPTTGSGSVAIWPRRIEAATEEEALAVAKQVTRRDEIAVIREVP